VVVTLALLGLFVRMIRVNGLVLAVLLVLVPLNEKMFFYEPPVWLFVLFALTGPMQPCAARRNAAVPETVHPGGIPPPAERLP
jgi:hypothetical protein